MNENIAMRCDVNKRIIRKWILFCFLILIVLSKVKVYGAEVQSITIVEYPKLIYREGTDFDFETKLKFSCQRSDGTVVEYDRRNFPPDMKIEIAGYSEEDEVPPTIGTYVVTLSCFGVSTQFQSKVVKFDEYIQQLEEIKEGVVKRDSSLYEVEYKFVPQKTGIYHFDCDAENNQTIWGSIVIYDAAGNQYETYCANEQERETGSIRLEQGKQYLVLGSLGMNDYLGDFLLLIDYYKEVKNVSVVRSHFGEFITEIDDRNDITDIDEGFLIQLTYDDSSTELVYPEDFERFGFQSTSDVDYEQSGTYTYRLYNNQLGFSESFPITVKTLEEASTKLENEEKTVAVLGCEKRGIFKLDSGSYGKYRFTLKKASGNLQIRLRNQSGEILETEKMDFSVSSGMRYVEWDLLGAIYYLELYEPTASEEVQNVTIRMDNMQLEKWRIQNFPKKKEYYPFEVKMASNPKEAVDLSGLSVNITYLNGTNQIITYGSKEWKDLDFDYSVSENWGQSNGNQNIIVYRGEDSETQTVTVHMNQLQDYPKEEIRTGDRIEVVLSQMEPYKVFIFTPTKTDNYTFQSAGSSDVIGALWKSDSTVMKEDGKNSLNFSMTEKLTAGETYYYICKYINGSGKLVVSMSGEHVHYFQKQVIQNADCTHDTVARYTCIYSSCGHYQYERIETGALGHQYRAVIEKASCTKRGKQYQICDRCGQKRDEETIDAQGHRWGMYTTIKKASEKQEGTEERICLVCGIKEQRVLRYQTLTTNIRTLIYKGKASSLKIKAKGKLTYKSSNTKVVKVTSSGRITPKAYGEAVITVKAAAVDGYQESEKKIKIQVVPKKTNIKKAASKKGGIDFSWKLDKTVSGYQVMISTHKQFKKNTIQRKYSNKTKGKVVLKGLPKKKTYYIRIRSYKKVGKKVLYGDFSNTKKVKVK